MTIQCHLHFFIVPDSIILGLLSCKLITMGRCLHVRLDRMPQYYHIFLFVWFTWVYYLYDTGLKEGIQRLGALCSSECRAERAQTAALTDKFW